MKDFQTLYRAAGFTQIEIAVLTGMSREKIAGVAKGRRRFRKDEERRVLALLRERIIKNLTIIMNDLNKQEAEATEKHGR